ncbi:hypothetical protein RND81_02G122000 [Saponaria officinalis]|uniref:Retrovirus-related Pol polyprotein from transposon TNT 1-94 n=1 Tax=Saponaria officinalis TaxID=3572 RepID=A0AAW1MTG1_SAPOF
MALDIAILTDEEPSAIKEDSSEAEKNRYEAWERSNRLSLNLMRMTMAENIKPSMPKTEKSREFMQKVKECSQSELADKSIVGSLMSQLTTKKFDWSQPIHDHVTHMSNLTSKLKTLGMDVSETFLVQFIMNSFPFEFGQFQVNYNTIKDKWNFQELKAMLIHEEGRLKKMRDQVVHLVGHDGASSSKTKPSLKGKKKGKSFFKGPESQIHKEKKCFFCKKVGHFKRDCLKRKAWFEKKGKHYSFGYSSIQPIRGAEQYLSMGNMMKARIEGIGTYRLILDTGCHIDLIDYLYIPDCARNLVSLSRLDNLGIKRSALNENSAYLWHQRLIHISKERLMRLVKNKILPQLDFSDLGVCVDFIKGKQTKHTVKKPATRSSQLLEIIHTDICGPFDAPWGGEKYFITFIDDFSRVKIVRSDRGGEFYGRFTENGQCPGPFAKLLESRGICAQYTMHSTPQQNGVAERRNRTLIEMVRSMFIENGQTSGSGEPRNVDIKEIQVEVPSPVVAPVPIITSGPSDTIEQNNDVQIPQVENIIDEPVTIQENNIVPQQKLRRSIRERRPAISNDFVVYSVESECDLSMNEDPMKSMDDNKVWDLVILPKGSKTVGSKWVYKTKRDSKGNIEKYKARLVSKGFTQKDGIEYKETFSPISKKDSLRIVLALVAHYDLELHQMDLRKSIYGLKHASRQWYLKFNDTITSYGFLEITVDRCIYIKISGSIFKYLSKNFEMKDMGEASYVIGIEIIRDRSRGTLGLSQKTYINKVLERYRMDKCSVGIKAAKKVLRYLQGTKELMFTYRRSDHLEVIGYSDSDYAGCVDSIKSTFGYVFLLADGAVSWKIGKQTVIATSTIEAEFVVCFEATIHALWLRNFISGLGIVDSISKPLRIYCDNFAAIFFSKNDKYSKGAKHMKLKFLSVKEEVQKQRVSFEHIRTDMMIADPLTKGLPPKAFIGHVERMSVLEKVLLL